MAELKGIGYLRKKLAAKKSRVDTRYKFYEMKNITKDFGISTPPELSNFMSVLGWCGKAADSISDRLFFRGFKNDNFDLKGIYNMNNPDILYDSAVLSALISSCCFIYISLDETGFPRLQVIDGGNATGEINQITGLLTEGYAVLSREPESGTPTQEAYYEPGKTTVYTKGIKEPDVYLFNCKHPLLVPIIYRPDAKRPFGHSRISRACMSIQASAIRTIKRSEIAAEFYSFPQKYVTGVSPEAEPMEKWRATMSALLEFTSDENGNDPKVGQFSQQSMAPHMEQLKMFASLFAGETGLTLDDLGITTGNPSSVEAIKAAHETLRITARKAMRSFGSGFLNAGYLAACLRDNVCYERRQVYLTTPIWEPIWEPDGTMLTMIGDGVVKINQAIPGYFGKDNFRDLTGIDFSTIPDSVNLEM